MQLFKFAILAIFGGLGLVKPQGESPSILTESNISTDSNIQRSTVLQLRQRLLSLTLFPPSPSRLFTRHPRLPSFAASLPSPIVQLSRLRLRLRSQLFPLLSVHLRFPQLTPALSRRQCLPPHLAHPAHCRLPQALFRRATLSIRKQQLAATPRSLLL